MSEFAAKSCPDVPSDQKIFKKKVSRHPFAILIIACLFVNATFNMSSEPLVSSQSLFYIIGIAAVAFLGYTYYTKYCSSPVVFSNIQGLAIVLISIAVFVGCLYSNNSIIYISFFGLLILAVIALYLVVNKKMTIDRLITILFIAGFILRVAYIVYTTVTERQHDVWYFNNSSYDQGHAGYIEYLYNNLHLPDFDPRSRWQFYHPPLHHIIAALWMRLNTFLGMNFARAVESIQVLTLFYSSACMIISYKIFKELNFKGFALVISTAIIVFHPTFIILSGSVNNDILSITLAFGAVLATIRWYKDPTISKILIIALCVGGAMMAKLSAALVAPPIAIVFLIKFIYDSKYFKKYILQFAVFGILCVPLGLWWQVYNAIKYGMPINYVPLLGASNIDQYVGFHSAFGRLFDFNFSQFKTIFVAWGAARNGASYYEYNVFIGLLKSSVFGEFSLFYLSHEEIVKATSAQILRNDIGIILSYSLFFSYLLVLTLSFVGGIITLIKKTAALCNTMKIFFASIFFVVLVSYVKFCFNFPHTCTQNIRYAVLLILTCALFTGSLVMAPQNQKCGKSTVALKWVVGVSVTLFCVLSTAVYLLLGFSV